MLYGPGQVKKIINHKAPQDRRKKTKDFQYCIIDKHNQTKWVDVQQLKNQRSMIDKYHANNPEAPNPFEKRKSSVLVYQYQNDQYGEEAINQRDMERTSRGRGRGRAPGRPPKNIYDDKPPRKQQMTYEMLPSSMPGTQYNIKQMKAEKPQGCYISVEGVFTDPNNHIYYLVRDETGAESIKSRKWVLGKDKKALVYFYETLIRVIGPGTMN